MVDLGKFTSDGHGRHLWGRLDASGEMTPYYTRKEIRTGKLDPKHLELMYADDAVDVIFAQIEGSAKAMMDDGSTVWLEFAGKNGRAYKGIGGVLRGSGELAPGQGTMQGIRKWFVDHASRFDEIADQDASFVFFKESAAPGAIGSQKTVLTARRSLAVDRAFIAMSTPVFVDTRCARAGQDRHRAMAAPRDRAGHRRRHHRRGARRHLLGRRRRGRRARRPDGRARPILGAAPQGRVEVVRREEVHAGLPEQVEDGVLVAESCAAAARRRGARRGA